MMRSEEFVTGAQLFAQHWLAHSNTELEWVWHEAPAALVCIQIPAYACFKTLPCTTKSSYLCCVHRMSGTWHWQTCW